METHEAVFTWILERLSAAGLVRGKTVGIDATTLEANAAMRSIERRDTGESRPTSQPRSIASITRDRTLRALSTPSIVSGVFSTLLNTSYVP